MASTTNNEDIFCKPSARDRRGNENPRNLHAKRNARSTFTIVSLFVIDRYKTFTMDEPAASAEDPPTAGTEANAEASTEKNDKAEEPENGVSSAAMRPIFLGNLKPNYQTDDIKAIFQKPLDPPGSEPGSFKPITVERLDQKRGYCFVFLKDAETAEDKDNAERFVAAISGM